MIRFRTRLLFALVTLIMVVLIGLGVLLGQLFKSYYFTTFNDRLEKESYYLADLIREDGGLGNIDVQKLDSASDKLDLRISIARADGTMLYDSGLEDSSSSVDHKKLIKEILTNEDNTQTHRKSVNSGYDLLYVWRDISTEMNGEEGILVLSTKIYALKKIYNQIWIILGISLGLALVVIILLGTRITSRYTKPIESATRVAIELAKGNYRARTYENHLDETGMLSTSINVLARNLQEMVKAQEMHQDRLGTLVENMGSGLVLIDSRGYIVLINRAYKEIFQVDPSEFLYKRYHEAMNQSDVVQLVEEIFMTEQKIRRQIHLSMGIERKHFEVYGAPIIGTNDEWKGILLVFHDISELKKLEQMRKDFVANVSHELKTPITSIKGFSETLLDGAMHNEQALTQFLSIILEESERLQSLIQDLLDLSKMEQQGFQINIGDVNVSGMLEDIKLLMNGKAEDKQVKLVVEAPTNIFIKGDTHRLKQVFLNLVSNALTYTPPEGQVVVTANDLGKNMEVVVSDSGIGMEKEELSRIFERFYRVDKARSRNSGGTGLGLAIVKHLVEAHKGKIEVRSTVGKGTTFTVTFPKE
ncbi:two-component system histidine kinase PnpS [Mangrovibacillus cuniculi]|uniref:histidine kinase n=1 Tax=Mangrovibacillus cuniculi TaxID=2593652 RepID=A0A7S8CC08_9BACI|nr:ATP-binding protein [Mangrovibacillus cuniculi]QPC47199.1 cell wall metabolism sensor histidine kinase WalK [Mangrovibacillus cuniculi]